MQNNTSPNSLVNVLTYLFYCVFYVLILWPLYKGTPCEYRQGSIENQVNLVVGKSALYRGKLQFIFSTSNILLVTPSVTRSFEPK